MMRRLYIAMALLSLPLLSKASVFINEVQPDNKTIYKYGINAYPDWIELKNDGSSSVDLSGYFLSDSKSNPGKWRIPDGTIIAPNSFLLFLADGWNTGLRTNFKLSANGENIVLANTDTTVIDSLSYPFLLEDMTYGRLADGSHGYFETGTPDAENDFLSGFSEYLDDPEISLGSGIYNSPQVVTIVSPAGATTYYTLDGSKPTTASNVYAGPFSINSTTVLKAIASDGINKSYVAGASFVFGASHTLPIIFITSGNEREEWVTKEVGKFDTDGRIRFEFIEPSGEKVLNQYANFRRSGNVSQSMPQINGKVSPAYGDKDFDYSFYPNKSIKENIGFLIRNSSQDYQMAHMRDALNSRILGEDDITDGFYFSGYRPAVIYVDGVYDGVVHIREDNDGTFAPNNFPDQNATLVSAGWGISLGTDSYDYSNPIDRATQQQDINIHDVLTVFHINHFFRAGEWEYWYNVEVEGRNPKKVTYIHDIDYGLGIGNGKHQWPFTSAVDAGMWGFPSNVLAYEPYKNEAAQFSSAFYNFVLDSVRVQQLVDNITDSYRGEMDATAAAGINTYNNPQGFAFGLPTYSNEEEWLRNVDTLKQNINVTNLGIHEWLKTNFSLSTQIDIQFQTSGQAHGHIRVHGIKVVEDDMNGLFFADIPLELEAIPETGYQFSHWEGDVSGSNEEISPTFSVASLVRAVFIPIPFVAHDLHINEVQAINDSTVADEFGEYNDWVEIYNKESYPVDLADYYVSDKTDNLTKWRIPNDDPTATTIEPGEWLLLWADNDAFQGAHHLDFKFDNKERFILTYPDGVTIVDSIHFDLGRDSSRGSLIDGSASDIIFNTPTPNRSNHLITSNGESLTVGHDFTLYPAPVDQHFYLQNESVTSLVDIDIIGLDGRVYQSLSEHNLGSQIDLDLPHPGVYFVRIKTEESIRSVKFLKR